MPRIYGQEFETYEVLRPRFECQFNMGSTEKGFAEPLDTLDATGQVLCVDADRPLSLSPKAERPGYSTDEC